MTKPVLLSAPKRHKHLLLYTLFALLLQSCFALAQQNRLAELELPAGFSIDIYATVPDARSMTVGRTLDTVFVGSRRSTVHAVLDWNQDRVVDDVVRFADNLNIPNGLVSTEDGWLYVAEANRISAYQKAEFNPYGRNQGVVIYDGLPVLPTHSWRYLTIGPDDKLYLALGAPCNICKADLPLGSIARLNRDGSNFEVYATGIRNSVGLAFNPQTETLFFTNNGADMLGDDVPADTILHAPEAGLYFGFPYVASSGDDTFSPDFAGQQAPQAISQAVVKLQAHSAPLGIHFYQGEMFPDDYTNVAFVAEHGSWNRSEPVGYQVSMFKFNSAGELLEQSVFIKGWLQQGQAWGRPVDIKELSDGSLLISDDSAGLIYRVSYQQP